MAVAPGVCSPLPTMTLATSPELMSDKPAEGHSASESASALPSATTAEVPAFGWSSYAERINGRFAMLGFVAVLLVEALSHDTFLHWAGLIP